MMEDFRHLSVQFFTDIKEDKKATKREGRPIYKEVEMVRIMPAGDPKSNLIAPAHDQSAQRDHNNQPLTYAQLHSGPYEAFRKGVEFHGSGTPLTEMQEISMARAKELNRLNIFTVEQLAGLDGSNLQRIGMGARDMKNAAQSYLDRAKENVDGSRLMAENAELRARLEKLEAALSVPDVNDPAPPNPFEGWEDGDIINWIKEQGGPSMPPHSKHETLVRKASELNASLQKAKEAA